MAVLNALGVPTVIIDPKNSKSVCTGNLWMLQNSFWILIIKAHFCEKQEWIYLDVHKSEKISFSYQVQTRKNTTFLFVSSCAFFFCITLKIDKVNKADSKREKNDLLIGL